MKLLLCMFKKYITAVLSCKRILSCFQELNLHLAFKYQCYSNKLKSKGQTWPHISRLALFYNEVASRSYSSIIMFIFIKLVPYIHTLKEFAIFYFTLQFSFSILFLFYYCNFLFTLQETI